MYNIPEKIAALRQKKPVILNLTNLVTMDFIANCLLALGAAPIMSVCEEELEELVQISSAVYINIGTLDQTFIRLIHQAIKFSNTYAKPIVLDPVGTGATTIRTEIAKSIAPHAAIIRGNASEIMSISEQSGTTKGVESTQTPEAAKHIATQLALSYQTTVVVSGLVDFITNGSRSFSVRYGSTLMQLITGMGCALTAVISAFSAVVDDPFEASVIGATYFALCGETVAFNNKHPGMFKNKFIDQLHAVDFMVMRRSLISDYVYDEI